MNRTKSIIIAASLTGLVLITILALGFGKVGANSVKDVSLPPAATQSSSAGMSNEELQQELQAWQQYSRELEQTVRVMQGREGQYQQQLDTANQVILQLEEEINRGRNIQFRSFFGEDESHEHEEFDD